MRRDTPVMKIGIVTEYYYPTLGGIQEHVHHFAQAARQLGHDVRIITPVVIDTLASLDGAVGPGGCGAPGSGERGDPAGALDPGVLGRVGRARIVGSRAVGAGRRAPAQRAVRRRPPALAADAHAAAAVLAAIVRADGRDVPQRRRPQHPLWGAARVAAALRRPAGRGDWRFGDGAGRPQTDVPGALARHPERRRTSRSSRPAAVVPSWTTAARTSCTSGASIRGTASTA